MKKNSRENQSGAMLDGTYTVVYPSGDHRTVKVETPKAGTLAGKTIASIMTGSNNESDYTGIGFLMNGELKFWRRIEAQLDAIRLKRIRRAFVIVASNPGRAYALNSGRCYICNRKLTHPESIETGIGPECRKRAGNWVQ